MENEKKQFSERLRTAMQAAGYEARPNVLEANFNARYWGRSVSYQAARRWLLGLSIPEQDKVQVLADWLGVEPHTLRYGRPVKPRALGETKPQWFRTLTAADREAIDQFLKLPTERKKVVRDLISALSS